MAVKVKQTGPVPVFRWRSLFYRNLCMLLITLLPLLIFGGYTYNMTRNTIQKQNIEVNRNMLKKTVELADEVLKSGESTLYQISNHPDVIQAVMGSGGGYNQSKRITTMLADATNHACVASVYVYVASSGTLYSSNSGMMDIRDYTDTQWLGEFNTQFLGTKTLLTRKTVDNMQKPQTYITMMRNVPYHTWSKKGGVVVNISQSVFQNQIEAKEQNGSKLLICDKVGTVISSGKEDEIGQKIQKLYGDEMTLIEEDVFLYQAGTEQMIAVYARSDYNDWLYYYSVPYKSFMEPVRLFGFLLVLITGLCLAVTVVMILTINRRIYTPIAKLMDKVVSVGTMPLLGEDEYEVLDQAWEKMQTSNVQLSNKIEETEPILRSRAVIEYLQGRVSEGCTAYLQKLEQDVQQQTMQVVLCRTDYDQEHTIVGIVSLKMMLREEIENFVAQKGVQIWFSNELDLREYVFVMLGEPLQEKEYQQLVEEVTPKFPFSVTLAVGVPVIGVTQLAQSMQTAQESMHYRFYFGSNTVYYNRSQLAVQEENGVLLELQKQLLNYVRVGDKEKAIQQLRTIQKELVQGKLPQVEQVKFALYMLEQNVLEELKKAGLHLDVEYAVLKKDMEQKDTLEECIQALQRLCEEACDRVIQGHVGRVNCNILQYIQEHLSQDISLRDVADASGFSGAYVSRLIKEETGRTYVDYLAFVRIEKAKTMLQDRSMSVAEVGSCCGFNNTQGFLRTFKKYEGVTPGQYRKHLATQEEEQ
ncbi:MAG: helix-turn-helix domain-containing protein [Eubacteriales bacterium]|jgi:two-component system response regulator YesN